MADAEQSDDDRAKAVEFVRTREITRVFRWAIMGLTVVLCTAKICDTVVVLTSKPPWLVLSIAILGAITGPSGYAMIIRRRMKKGAELRHDIVRRAQGTIDKDRTGTGLNRNGTNPPGSPS